MKTIIGYPLFGAGWTIGIVTAGAVWLWAAIRAGYQRGRYEYN